MRNTTSYIVSASTCHIVLEFLYVLLYEYELLLKCCVLFVDLFNLPLYKYSVSCVTFELTKAIVK